MPMEHRSIGKPVPRLEEADKVTGQRLYAADIPLENLLWAQVLRSPVPHARVLSIDISKAKKLAGVHAVLTGMDLPSIFVGRRMKDMPVLARDRVRYAGEPLAAVAAETLEIAQEAVRLIDVEYEELPYVVDPLEAMQPLAPLIHDDPAVYKNAPPRAVKIPNLQSLAIWERGDLETGFRKADSVFEHTFRTQLTHHGYLEPHACMVWARSSGKLEIWASNKEPYVLRRVLSEDLGISAESIKVHILSVGGDFGGKDSISDVPICYFLAARSGMPVKLVLSYTEELRASGQRHPALITLRAAVKRDGTICGMEAKVVFAGGAYAALKHSREVTVMGARRVASYYRVPAIRIESFCAYTNHVPCTQARAPGSPQIVFALESQLDIIARDLGLDPVEIRLKNLQKDGDATPLGQQLKNICAAESLRQAVAVSTWRRVKPTAFYGRGLAMYERGAGTGRSSAALSLDAEGKVLVLTGVPDCGPGIYTIIRQIVSETLGVKIEQVQVRAYDTDTVPYDTGIGGSKATNTAGHAAYQAAQKTRAKLIVLAAKQLGCPPESVRIVNGWFYGIGKKKLSFKEIARFVVLESGGSFSHTEIFEPSDQRSVTSFCAQVAEVEVDAETGRVDVKRLITAHDTGTVLNSLTHQGQIDGGVIQGMGFALMEETAVVEGRVATQNLGDFKMPNVKDVPRLETVILDSMAGPVPFQGKAIGEIPNVPTAAAIANAIADAVGLRLFELPLTSEKLYWALRKGTPQAQSEAQSDGRGNSTSISTE